MSYRNRQLTGIEQISIKSSDFALLKMVSTELQMVNISDKLEIVSYSCNKSGSSTSIVHRKKRRANVLSISESEEIEDNL